LAGLAINVFYLANLTSLSFISTLFFDSTVNSRTGCDFNALYLAAGNLSEGKSVYFEPDEKPPDFCHYSFRYLPVAAVVGLPFKGFHHKKAYLFWVILLELLVLVNVAIAYYVSPSDKLFALCAFFSLSLSPLYLEFYMGQYSLLQSTLIFLALASSYIGKEKIFNMAWAASLCWKLNTWIALPALIIQKKWKPLALGGGILLVTTALYFFIQKESFGVFLVTNFHPDPDLGLTRGNLGAIKLISVLLGSEYNKAILVLVPIIIICFTLAINLVYKRAKLVDSISLWMAAYFLAYKHIWEHHYVMLAPVIIILGVKYKSGFLFLPAILVALPTVFYFTSADAAAAGLGADWTFGWEFLYHLQKPAAAFLIYLFCLAKIRKC